MTSKTNKPTASGPDQPTRPARTAEDLARYQAIRERFQREKPSLAELVSSGEYNEPLPMGEHLSIRQAVFALRKAREAAGLSLADVAERTGIDKAALSRIETGQHPNPTVSTLCRYAHALGKRWKWVLENEAVSEREAATGDEHMSKQPIAETTSGGKHTMHRDPEQGPIRILRKGARSGPVKNWVLANRGDFTDRHYTMKADPGLNYFFNLRPRVLTRLRRTFGADFCVVIAGDKDAENDFWAIPFARVAHLFTDQTLTKDSSKNPGRWLCNIVRGQLHLFPGTEDGQRGSALMTDVSDCYSDRNRLE